MSLTREQIESIARLARLSLGADEAGALQASLAGILDFVGALERAETSGIEPMAHPLAGLSQRLREDAVTEIDRHELFQRNAPQVAAGLYLVPRVIE